MCRILKRVLSMIMLCMMMGTVAEPITVLAEYQIVDYGDGDTYEGNINEAGEKSGAGIYRTGSGAVITGSWKNNYLNGKATVVYANGARYVGNFKRDVRSGKGKFYFANGDVYSGYWKSDKMHGKGKYTWKKKWTLEGVWNKGKINGNCTFKNSSYIYTLSVKNGKLNKVISRRKK